MVFVFDGSSEPFLDAETLLFFQDVFQDCTKLGEQATALALYYGPLSYVSICHTEIFTVSIMYFLQC